MRMEAKNKYFKDVAHSSNFKNVCFTISKRHQKLLCSYVMSSSFFDKGIEYGPGIRICNHNVIDICMKITL